MRIYGRERVDTNILMRGSKSEYIDERMRESRSEYMNERE